MEKKIKRKEVNEPAETNLPAIEVNGQYVKDLSFENPRSLHLDPAGPQPNITVNVETKAKHISGATYEVELSVNVEATQQGNVIFLLELVYAGLFTVPQLPEENTEMVLMIECPRLLFPFARNIVADLVRDGGFPPLLLNPIDFAALYQAPKP